MHLLFSVKEYLQYLSVFFGSLNIFTSGTIYGWSSTSLPKLQDRNNHEVPFHLSDSEGSWIAIGQLFGAIVICPLTAYFIDIIGRRRAIMLAFIPYVTSWITVAFAESFASLIFGRIVAGIGDGCMFITLPIYIGEISDPNVRGKLGSCIPVFHILGVLFVNITGAILSIRSTALICVIFPVTSFIGMSFMPETPYYLMINGDVSGAEKSLRRLRGADDVQEEIDRIKEGQVYQRSETKGAFRDIFWIPRNRKALMIMVVIRAAQQLSGISAISFYIVFILQESGANYSATTASIIFFIAQLIMVFFSSSFSDTIGRRVLLLTSLFGVFISLIIIGLYFQLQFSGVDTSHLSVVPLIALILYIVSYGFGLQNVPYIMVGELFSTNVKSILVCAGEIYYNILVSVVSKYFQFMNSNVGAYVSFYSFALCCFICFWFTYFFVPETKGITLEEIQHLLQMGKDYKSGTSDNLIKE